MKLWAAKLKKQRVELHNLLPIGSSLHIWCALEKQQQTHPFLISMSFHRSGGQQESKHLAKFEWMRNIYIINHMEFLQLIQGWYSPFLELTRNTNSRIGWLFELWMLTQGKKGCEKCCGENFNISCLFPSRI